MRRRRLPRSDAGGMAGHGGGSVRPAPPRPDLPRQARVVLAGSVVNAVGTGLVLPFLLI